LTDSVRCVADSPYTFSCEVLLDSDPDPLTCEAPEPEAAPVLPPQTSSPAPASSPAVSSLVSSFVSRTAMQPPPAPLVSGAALLKCGSELASVVLAAVVPKNPVLAGLTMLKASFDVSRCLALAHNDASQRNAEDYCLAQGGVVLGDQGENVICEVRETAK